MTHGILGSLDRYSDVTRLFDFPYYQLAYQQQDISFACKKEGKWECISTRIFIEQASRLSRGLIKMGVEKGDKIAIISSYNCTQWHIIDVAVTQVGAYLVPMYPDVSDKDYQYIFNHAEISYVFVSGKEIYDKVTRVSSQIKTLKGVYTFKKIKQCPNWEEILEMGRKTTDQRRLEEIKSSIDTDDIATIIYTSGTTGKPKGVMLSHRNIISNVMACKERFLMKEGAVALSFLPISHIYERMIIYLYMYSGLSVYFAESLDKIGDNIREVSPHIITAVPRLLEKVFDKIYDKGSSLKGIKRWMFLWAVSIGKNYHPYKPLPMLSRIKIYVARKLIFSKWIAALGGRLTTIVSGSAPLPLYLSKIFSASGLIILEGYGLTETSPVISVGNANKQEIKLGTVGKPLNNLKIKIAEDGEILCKGPNVMKGYYKDSKLTSQVMTEDGYFHTGDIGYLDYQGYLTITDRKKEIFKTSGGKYIAPQHIENKLKSSSFIEQAMVIGEGEKMPAVFLQPQFDYLQNWARNHQISEELPQLLTHKSVLEVYQQEVDKCNSSLGHWEQVKVFALTADRWSVEEGLLTPTMKIKRRKILAKYQELYDKIYPKNDSLS